MSEKKSDVLEPNYDGALIENKYIKAGFFVVKTLQQRNETIKKLYRTIDPTTTTICYVSAQSSLYELISDPSTEETTNQDWKKLDFGVSDILVAKGSWDADNTTPSILDSEAIGAGNDFYVVTGAPTAISVQYSGLFGGQSITVKDGDWIISNGVEWFNSAAPINWDTISGIPQTILDYVAGSVVGHNHSVADVTDLQTFLNLKYDFFNVGSHVTAFNSLADDKLIDVFIAKTNFYQKSETYSQTQVDALIAGAISGVGILTNKGDLVSHDGVSEVRVPIGSDGQIVVANSASASGWEWIEKNDAFSTESTSNTLLFDKSYINGEWLAPITGDLIIDQSSAKNGVTTYVIWSGNSTPNITGGIIQQQSGLISTQGIYTFKIQHFHGRFNLDIFNVAGTPGVIIPTLVSATVENDFPFNVVMVFSEIVTGTNAGFTIGGTTSSTFDSITGFGTDTLTGVLSDTVLHGETLNLFYDILVGDIINASLQPLATIVGGILVNNVNAIQTLLYENDFSIDTGLLVTTSEGASRTMEIDGDGARLRVLINGTTMYAELDMAGLAGYAAGKNYKIELDWIDYTHTNNQPLTVKYPNLGVSISPSILTTTAFPLLQQEYLFITDASSSKIFISATGTGNLVGDIWKIDNLKIYEVF